MSNSNRKSTISRLADEFGSRLGEFEHSYSSDIFQHIVRASSLTRIIGLSTHEALDTLVDLRSKCNHLSYYWIQVGILYRNLSDFSNAQNAFENAKAAHKKDTYQIAHHGRDHGPRDAGAAEPHGVEPASSRLSQ